MKNVFPIILEKGDIFKQLNKKKNEFLDSNYPVAAIDLTNASIPNSTQLGEITVIIKTSTTRNGATYIYTDNEDAIDILDQVHFSSIATILSDKEKFDKIVKGEIKTTDIPKTKKIIPPNNVSNNHESKTDSKELQTKKTLSYNIVIISLLIINILLSISVAFYTKTEVNKNREILNAIIKADKELQEKTSDLSNKVKELELLNELSE